MEEIVGFPYFGECGVRVASKRLQCGPCGFEAVFRYSPRRQPCCLTFEQLPDVENFHEGFGGEGTDCDAPIGLLVDEPLSLQPSKSFSNGRAGGLQPLSH